MKKLGGLICKRKNGATKNITRNRIKKGTIYTCGHMRIYLDKGMTKNGR